MSKLKKGLSIIIILLIIGLVYSFFHISGWEIRNLNSLSEAESVTLTVYDDSNGESLEYELSKNQIQKIQVLLKENSYTRRISNTIIGVLPDKSYRILANWNDNGQKHLYISMIGGEYINIARQFGDKYHKIKDPDFEKELIAIIESE